MSLADRQRSGNFINVTSCNQKDNQQLYSKEDTYSFYFWAILKLWLD